MASVRKKGNVYYARFRLPRDSQPVEKSTGKNTLAEARVRAAEMELIAKGEVSEARYAQRMEDLHAEATGVNRSLSVCELCEIWLSNKLGEVDDDTYASYNRVLRRWREFLGKVAGESIQRGNIQDLERWKKSELKSHEATTVNFKIKVVRMLFLYAYQRGYIFSNPAVLLKIIDREKRNAQGKDAFTLEQVKTVIDTCDSHDVKWKATVSLEEWKSLVIFGAYTAQRLGDLSSSMYPTASV